MGCKEFSETATRAAASDPSLSHWFPTQIWCWWWQTRCARATLPGFRSPRPKLPTGQRTNPRATTVRSSRAICIERSQCLACITIRRRKRSAFVAPPMGSSLPSSSSSYRSSSPFCDYWSKRLLMCNCMPSWCRHVQMHHKIADAYACASREGSGILMHMSLKQFFCQRTLWALACCASPVQT